MMKNLQTFLLAVCFFTFSLPVVAQPSYSSDRLLWKIAVEEKNEKIKIIDSTNWQEVSFYSERADISYRFIKETSYFEIILNSNGAPDLQVAYDGRQMLFPDIRPASMGYYKLVILGREDEYDPQIGWDMNLRSGKSSRAFFDDPSEHMTLSIDHSSDIVTVCPKHIIVKRNRSTADCTPLNDDGMISIIRYDAGTKMFFCPTEDYTTTLDTVAVPTDLKPRASLLLNVQLNDAALCKDTAISRIGLKLPLYASTLSSYYQLSINGHPVNRTLRIPHRFIYTKNYLPDNWIRAGKSEWVNGMNCKTLNNGND